MVLHFYRRSTHNSREISELYEQELRKRLNQILSCTEMELNEGKEKMIFMAFECKNTVDRHWISIIKDEKERKRRISAHGVSSFQQHLYGLRTLKATKLSLIVTRFLKTPRWYGQFACPRKGKINLKNFERLKFVVTFQGQSAVPAISVLTSSTAFCIFVVTIAATQFNYAFDHLETT